MMNHPFAPLIREPDGLVLDAQGIMINVAPVSTKYLSLVNSSVSKINPAFAGNAWLWPSSVQPLLPSQ
jgi:hypothetical protein